MTAARRGFLKALAIAPIAPLAPQAPAQAPAAPPPGPPAGAAGVADALAEAVRREFGAQLDEQELAAVRREIESTLGSAFRLRAAARLRNADEPVTRFEPYAPGSPARGARR